MNRFVKFKNRIVEGTTDIYPKNLEDVKAKCHENSPNVYGHTPLYADVINAIKQDRQPYVTAMDGKRALDLVLVIYKSVAV